MRCAICGFSNIHGAKFCSECGSPLQMQDAGKSARRNSDRKVIKLPSDMANEPTTPIERPWKCACPSARPRPPRQVRPLERQSTPRHPARRARAPRPRRRTGTTGRIPAIKRPANEDGKIPVEERASSAASRTRMTGAVSSPSPHDTAPILIDDLAAATPTAVGGAHPVPRPDRDAVRATMRQPSRTTTQAEEGESSPSSLRSSSCAASWHLASISRIRETAPRR